MLEFKIEVRHSWPNTSFQRALTRGGFGPLTSDR
jgi:hypothetical protein